MLVYYDFFYRLAKAQKVDSRVGDTDVLRVYGILHADKGGADVAAHDVVYFEGGRVTGWLSGWVTGLLSGWVAEWLGSWVTGFSTDGEGAILNVDTSTDDFSAYDACDGVATDVDDIIVVAVFGAAAQGVAIEVDGYLDAARDGEDAAHLYVVCEAYAGTIGDGVAQCVLVSHGNLGGC